MVDTPPEGSAKVSLTSLIARVQEFKKEEGKTNRFLDATLAPLHSCVGRNDFEDELRKMYVEPQKKKAIILPKEGTKFIITDTHGKKEDLFKTLGVMINEWLKGNDSYLIINGDAIHGLKVKKDDSFVPAYKDNSIENVAVILKLREIVGDRLIWNIGDHELVLLYRKFGLSKYGSFIENEIADQLNAGENKTLEDKIKELPFMTVANGFAIIHAGSIPAMDNISEAEEVHYDYDENPDVMSKFRSPPRPGESNYDEKQMRWFNGTIVGQATMGIRETVLVHTKKDGKEVVDEETRRVISKENNAKFLKKLGLDFLATGHNGLGNFIVEDLYVPGTKHIDGTEVYVEKNGRKIHVGNLYPSINEKEIVHGQIIMNTTEGEGYEDCKEEETSNHGAWGAVNNESCYRIGKIGRKLNRKIPLKAFSIPEAEKKEPATSKENLTKKEISLEENLRIATFSAMHDKQSLLPEFYEKYSRNGFYKLQNDLKTGKISRKSIEKQIMIFENVPVNIAVWRENRSYYIKTKNTIPGLKEKTTIILSELRSYFE